MSQESDTVHMPMTPSLDTTAIARQAIVDQSGAVFGYELFDRSMQNQPHSAASDAQLLFNALSHADNTALVDNRKMFVNCTLSSLAGGHLDLVQPDRIVLEIPPAATPEEVEDRTQSLADVRRRGFHLAFKQDVLEPAYAQWLPLAGFIKIDMVEVDPIELPALVRKARAASRTPGRGDLRDNFRQDIFVDVGSSRSRFSSAK